MKVLFAGDIDSNVPHLEWLLAYASDNDVDRIICLGDFGYWPNTTWGDNYLTAAHNLANKHNIPIQWVDGNHENHAALHALTATHGDQQPIPTGGDMITYLPRGCTIDLDGARLLAYGGAWSMDWMDRIEGADWWPEETIDFDHLERIAETTGPIDILASHECPAGEPVGHYGDHPVAAVQRLYIGHLVDKTKPRLVVGAHHQARATWNDPVTGAPVHALGRVGQGIDSTLIVDTAIFTSPHAT